MSNYISKAHKNSFEMIYKIIPAPLPLSYAVRHYWFIEETVNDNEHATFRLMAEGFPNLAFQYDSAFQNADNGEYFPSVILHGHTSLLHTVKNTKGFGVCGIAFYPYAFSYLFSLPPTVIANKIIDAKDILGSGISEIEDRLTYAGSAARRADIFSTWLSKKTAAKEKRSDKIIEYAVKEVIKRQGTIQIENIAAYLCISRRHLERKFLNQMGLRPKLYARILRFESTLLHPCRSIADVAYSFGYADQAHFTREFKSFSGICPKQYFKLENEAAENFMRLSDDDINNRKWITK